MTERYLALRKLLRHGFGLLILCPALITGCEFPPQPLAGARLSEAHYIEVTDNTVTVSVHDASLHVLLIEIARQSRMELLTHDSLSESVTVEFHQVPLPAAIGRLLRDRSFALHFVDVAGSRADEGMPPNRLWVYARGTQETDPRPQPESTGEEATKLTFDLAHENTEVRVDAVSDLSSLNDKQTLQVVEHTALHDWDAAVRTEALDLLGELGNDDALPILEQALYDPAREVREAAVNAIADIGGLASIQALTTALVSADPDVREDAVDALGEIGGEAVVALLQQALTDEQSSIRAAAAEYLKEL